MLQSSRRTGFALSFLGLLAVCLSLQHTPVVAGKDAPAAKSKSKRRPEKPKKGKSAEENSSATQAETKSPSSDNGSGLPASVPGGILSLPSAGGPTARSNGKGSSSGVSNGQQKQPAGKTSQPSDQGPNPELVKKVIDIQNRATPDLMSQK